jgi:hypothetical protein
MADETKVAEFEPGQTIHVRIENHAGVLRYEASVVKVTRRRVLVRWNQWTPKGDKGREAYVPMYAIEKASPAR